MIDLYRLLNDLDRFDDWNDYHRALRILCVTARRYNRIWEELEQIKELAGFNKPFPILRLPREIRDKIYKYSLSPIIEFDITHIQWGLPVKDNPFKCPTPGLLRTSKQIYHEAVEVLYSKNIFTFDVPSALIAFQSQIGPENCKRVRQICIWAEFPVRSREVRDSKYLPRSEYDKYPSDWIAALAACRFEKIIHLDIEVYSHTSSHIMPEDLQEFVKRFLGRVAENEVPRLTLTGFREEERQKFPKEWKVDMDDWVYRNWIKSMSWDLFEDYSQLK